MPADSVAGAALLDLDRPFEVVAASSVDVLFAAPFAPRPRREDDVEVEVVSSAPVVAAAFDSLRFASRTARRLTGPRTGTRATKTQPTPGTGLPPQSRPSSKSHS